MQRAAMFAVVLYALVAAMLASPAAAAGRDCLGTFSFTGAEQWCTVPADVTALRVVAVGGRGSGRGAVVQADVPVTAGDVLFVEVGGNAVGASGGFNGGGNGGGDILGSASGGGGASDVREGSRSQPGSLSSRLIVAGGGGGYGEDEPDVPHRGGGRGGDAGSPGTSGGGGGGGGAATQSFGGPGGAACLEFAPSGQSGYQGVGGSSSGWAGGGGGGGGYYGGGAGGGGSGSGCVLGGGGGGGSSYPLNGIVAIDTTATPRVTFSAPVAASTAPPSIAGATVEGQSLTTTGATWTNNPTSRSLQWQRCDAAGANCTPITGATRDTYTLSAADVGSTIRVADQASNLYGTSGPSTSDASSVVQSGRPLATGSPTITGAALQGQVLTEAHAAWTNTPTGYAYQWLRCNAANGACTAIAGANAQTYRLAAEDIGATVRVQEIASNAFGLGQVATSEPSGIVASARPVATSLPTIAGAPVQGHVLTVGYAAWTNNPNGYALQWLRCDRASARCSEIGGATDLTYRLRAKDVGATIRVREAGVNQFDRGDPATSTATGVVRPRPRITSGVRNLWQVQNRRTQVRVLAIRDAPVGASIRLRCRGRGCPARLKPIKATGGKMIQLTQFFKRPLASGSIIEIRITAPRFIGKYVRYKMHRRTIPKGTVLCLYSNTSRPAACPAGT
jgi:hypothetical protein